MIKKISSDSLRIIGIIFLIALTFGDVLTTYYVLNRGGLEGNPVARYVINTFGWVIAIILKTVQMWLVCWLLGIVYRHNKSFGLSALYMAVGIFMMVVMSNTMILYNYWL
jgi:hypothetical protein